MPPQKKSNPQLDSAKNLLEDHKTQILVLTSNSLAIDRELGEIAAKLNDPSEAPGPLLQKQAELKKRQQAIATEKEILEARLPSLEQQIEDHDHEARLEKARILVAEADAICDSYMPQINACSKELTRLVQELWSKVEQAQLWAYPMVFRADNDLGPNDQTGSYILWGMARCTTMSRPDVPMFAKYSLGWRAIPHRPLPEPELEQAIAPTSETVSEPSEKSLESEAFEQPVEV